MEKIKRLHHYYLLPEIPLQLIRIDLLHSSNKEILNRNRIAWFILLYLL